MTDPQTEIENLHDRIKTSDEISDEDASLLIDFSEQLGLLRTKYSDFRRRDLLARCTRIAENVGGITEALEDREAAEDIVRWIHRNYENEWTNADYREALRLISGHMTDGELEEKPDSTVWIPTGTSSDHDPRPDPGDMLEWEENVKPMIDSCRNPRDKALIAVAFDSGARSGELQDPEVGDVSDHEHGLQIHLDGRMGQRSVTLIPSVPYLNRWLSEHPGSDDASAPLWSKLSSPEEISYRLFNNIFKDAADRVGVTKPVTPTNFRKSNATYLAKQGVNQAYIEDRQGRKRGSEATAFYIAKFGGEADDRYAEIHGLEVETEEAETHAPLECPRCNKQTPADEDFCVWCHQAMDPNAVEKIEEKQTEQRRNLLRLSQENPELLETLEEMEPLINALGDDPELLNVASEFVESNS
jgi:integrase